MKKATFILMIIAILSKILGFGREVVLSYYFGASNISDAYLISWTIPGVIFSFIGVGISTSFIPIYSSIDKDSEELDRTRFINNLLNVITILITLIVIMVILFTPHIVKIFASGFDAQTYKIAIIFTRISIVSIYFSCYIYIFSSFLQIKRNFITPALIGIPLNIVIIISIILGAKLNIIILAIGIVAAKLVEFFVLFKSIRKQNYRYSLFVDLKDSKLREMIVLAIPVIIGVSVNQINTLIDRTIASGITAGGISALNYANKINSFVQGIFIMSFTTVLYPLISNMIVNNNISGMKKAVKESINSILILVIPAAFGSMIFNEQIVSLLFGRGAFDANAISMTSYALFFYSIGMIGFGLREVLSRAFYSLQDTKTPMINASIAMIMNIILNLILSKYLGIGGLALATSISAIFCTALLFVSLRKKIGPFGMKNIAISFIKILCASLVMGVIAKISYSTLINNINDNLSLIISIGIGALTYFIIIYFMKIEEVDIVVNAVKKKLQGSLVNG